MADSNMNDTKSMDATRKDLKRKLLHDESLDLVAVSNMDGTYEPTTKNPKLSQEETFDFAGLPWVLQKRFAEICDPETLKTFARINADTSNLVKRCHTIEDVEITINDSGELNYKFTAACYCKEDEYCKGINADDLSSFNGKFQVINSITIKATKEQKIDDLLLQRLPFKLNSSKHLKLTAKSMDLLTLKRSMNPELKSFDFTGGIESNCSLEGFVNFIKYLSRMDKFCFVLNKSRSSLSFDFDALIQQGTILHFQQVVTRFFGLFHLAQIQNPIIDDFSLFFIKGFYL